MSDMKQTLEQLTLEKHQALAAMREWRQVACALALAHGEKGKDGKVVARIPKALSNRLDGYSLETKPLKGGLVLTLAPTDQSS
ncbi:MAG TPA: hypothetical protein VF377_06865 [Acidimicrobiia bacterium]